MSRRLAVLAIVLLGLFWATRLIALDSFPPFGDEGVHLTFAEQMRTLRSPFVNAVDGRLFETWWVFPFQPFASAASVWVIRAATLLAVLPGFAAVIGSGWLVAGLWGGLLSGLAYLFSTYHFFFDRLALADPISASAVLVGVYFAFRLTRRQSAFDAVVCGLACFVAFGAKLSALPYLGLPLLAVLTLPPREIGWRARLRWAGLGLTASLGLAALLIGVTAWRGYDLLYHLVATSPAGAAGGGLTSLIEALPQHIALTAEITAAYTGPLLFLGLLAAVLILALRRRFFLPLTLLLPLGLVWLSSRQNARYFMASVTILLLCGAVALALETRRRPLPVRGLALGLVLIWGAGQWLPFALTSALDPVKLPLSGYDREEYIASSASGFGLDTLVAELEARQPTRVIGLLANCAVLHYTTLGRLPVECLHLNPNGEDIPTLAALLESSREPGTLAVLEALPYLPPDAPGTPLAVLDDPSGRPRLTVYDLSPAP